MLGVGIAERGRLALAKQALFALLKQLAAALVGRPHGRAGITL